MPVAHLNTLYYLRSSQTPTTCLGRDMTSLSTSTPVFRQHGEAIKGHTDSINCIKFSPDGKHLASGAEDTLILIFDAKTFQLTKRYRALSEVRTLTWHPTRSGILLFGLKSGVINTILLKGSRLSRRIFETEFFNRVASCSTSTRWKAPSIAWILTPKERPWPSGTPIESWWLQQRRPVCDLR